MLIAIDGSSLHESGADYSRLYTNTHVRQFYDRYQVRDGKTYIQGPVGYAFLRTTGAIADQGFAYITRMMREHRRRGVAFPDLFFTGWSRGAAACVRLAQRLRDTTETRELHIAGMFLFDCVDQDASVAVDTIPRNVARVFHAARSDWAGGGGSGVVQRVIFPTTHFRCESVSTRHKEKQFGLSHGEIGNGSMEVLHWMLDKARKINASI